MDDISGAALVFLVERNALTLLSAERRFSLFDLLFGLEARDLAVECGLQAFAVSRVTKSRVIPASRERT